VRAVEYKTGLLRVDTCSLTALRLVVIICDHHVRSVTVERLECAMGAQEEGGSAHSELRRRFSAALTRAPKRGKEADELLVELTSLRSATERALFSLERTPPSSHLTVRDSFGDDRALGELDSAYPCSGRPGPSIPTSNHHPQPYLTRCTGDIDSALPNTSNDPPARSNHSLPVADLEHTFELSDESLDSGVRIELSSNSAKSARLLDVWEHSFDRSALRMLIAAKRTSTDLWACSLQTVKPGCFSEPTVSFSLSDDFASSHALGRRFECVELPVHTGCSPASEMALIATGATVLDTGFERAASALISIHGTQGDDQSTYDRFRYLGSTPDCRDVLCLKLHSSGQLLAGCSGGCIVRWQLPHSWANSWPPAQRLGQITSRSPKSSVLQLEEVKRNTTLDDKRTVVGCRADGSVSVWDVGVERPGLLECFSNATFALRGVMPLALGQSVVHNANSLDNVSMPLLTLMAPKVFEEAEMECRVAWLKGGESAVAQCEKMPLEEAATCVSCWEGVAAVGGARGTVWVWRVRDGSLLSTITVCTEQTAVTIVKALRPSKDGKEICVCASAESGACIAACV